MRHYCTLFDSKYLAQGLVLYESLKKHSSEEFRLWIMPLDDECDAVLRSMNYDSLISLNCFNAAQYPAKEIYGRTWQEYCWTSASNLAEYFINFYHPVDDITYLDADLMFFSDPKVIFDEIGERSMAVIPHRLAENKDKARLSKNGKFNVSWVTFKNNAVGRECLSTWAAQCRERCSAEVGCGDQGYLDSWPEKYGEELCVIQSIGAGVAPWNLSQYSLANYRLLDTPQVDGVPIVFYHYHEYIHGERLTNYRLREEDKQLIYAPYMDAVSRQEHRIQEARVHA